MTTLKDILNDLTFDVVALINAAEQKTDDKIFNDAREKLVERYIKTIVIRLIGQS